MSEPVSERPSYFIYTPVKQKAHQDLFSQRRVTDLTPGDTQWGQPTAQGAGLLQTGCELMQLYSFSLEMMETWSSCLVSCELTPVTT